MARGLAGMFDGARLREARARADGGRGISAAELAVRVGASKAQILAYEHARYCPDPQRIQALAKALGVSPLQLADEAGKASWTLADLRRASGLRARDVTGRLKVSPRGLRRLESEGLVSARSFSLVAAVAECLGVTVDDIEEHLSNVPVVRERLERARVPCGALLERYRAPGRLDVPAPDEPEVVELAALYGRPASVVARLMGHEVLRVRGAQRRLAGFAAVADYGGSADEQADARRGVHAERERIGQISASLPGRLDAFFRCLLPAETWRAVALLQTVRGFGLWLSPGQLGIDASAVTSIPAALCRTSTAGGDGDAALYQISPEGSEHCARYRSWYDVLYPGIRTILQARESQLSGHVSGAALREHFRLAQSVLFSFDGLLCRLFATNLQSVSDHLVQAALALRLSVGPQTPTDPVGMLRDLVRVGSPAQIRRLDHFLTLRETEAAQHAEPLPGAQQLLRVLMEGPWRLAVVTDHAAQAVDTFLAHLAPVIGSDRVRVFGRPANPRLMKPHPHAVALAVGTLGSPHAQTILIGESVADALAARTAGVVFIGLAPTPRKAQMLREAGATVTVGSLREITSVVRSLTTAPYTRGRMP